MRAIISAVVLLSLCTALVLANAIALCGVLGEMIELCDKISSDQEAPQELRELFVEHRSLLALSIESDELERLGELPTKIYGLVPSVGQISCDDLAEAGLAIGEVMAATATMEIEGVIEVLPGGLLKRKP